jgi:hypothetical protein
MVTVGRNAALFHLGAGDIGPVEKGPANRTGRNRTLRNMPLLKIFLKRSYFSVIVGLFLPFISKFHKVL